MLSLYENGESWPKPDTLNNIAAYGNVSTLWLLGAEPYREQPAPTKEEALRLVLTSDPSFVESIKAEMRHQIREETPPYNGLTNDEQRLLKEFRLLDQRRKERLIDTAIDMSTALLRGSDQEEQGGGKDCAEAK